MICTNTNTVILERHCAQIKFRVHQDLNVVLRKSQIAGGWVEGERRRKYLCTTFPGFGPLPWLLSEPRHQAEGTFILTQHGHSHTHTSFPFTCPMDRSKHWNGLLGKEERGLAHLVRGLYIFPDHLKGKHKALSCRRTEDCWRIWNYFLDRRKLQDKMTAVILDKILLSSQCFHTKEILKLKNPERSLILLLPQPHWKKD